jgi:hypothetical protein
LVQRTLNKNATRKRYRGIYMDTLQSAITEETQRNYWEIKRDLVLVESLRPTITKDGNKWCVLLGENLQVGIAGFGDTPYQAMLDFNSAFHRN